MGLIYLYLGESGFEKIWFFEAFKHLHVYSNVSDFLLQMLFLRAKINFTFPTNIVFVY